MEGGLLGKVCGGGGGDGRQQNHAKSNQNRYLHARFFVGHEIPFTRTGGRTSAEQNQQHQQHQALSTWRAGGWVAQTACHFPPQGCRCGIYVVMSLALCLLVAIL